MVFPSFPETAEREVRKIVSRKLKRDVAVQVIHCDKIVLL